MAKRYKRNPFAAFVRVKFLGVLTAASVALRHPSDGAISPSYK